MEIKYYIKRGTYLAIIFSILSVISILFIDKPFALWIHNTGLDNWQFPRYIAETAQYWLGGISFLTIMLIYPSPQQFNKTDDYISEGFTIFQTSNSSFNIARIIYFSLVVSITLWIMAELKIFFGRDWPLHWVGLNEGLIPDGVYRFNILKSKTWRGSFPSGHTTYATAASIIMYLLYSRVKYLWLTFMLAVIIPMIMLNYHFVGDCLAGAALGVMCAYYGVALHHFILIKINNSSKSSQVAQENR